MSSFDLPSPDTFTAGTVGEPGSRVFYLQVTDDQLVISVRCEKQQVAALADYFDGLLEDLEPAPFGSVAADLQFRAPVQELWTVGPIGVAYDEPADRIVVVLEELTAEDDEAEESASIRVRLTRAQVAAFVPHARTLVDAGRPPCIFCGRPLDPDGHACPRMN
jgi:uncharacterized repeat protein (TIGR03847 family)